MKINKISIIISSIFLVAPFAFAATSVQEARVLQGGRLELVALGDDTFEKEIRFKGKAIFKNQTKELEFLSIQKEFKFGPVDLIVFSSNAGAASPPDYYILAFDASGNIKNLTPSSSLSGAGEAKFTRTPDGVEMDLGYVNKKQIIAIVKIDSKSVSNSSVTLKQAGSLNDKSITVDDCSWLYGQVISECIQSANSDPACSTPQGTLSMGSQRGVYSIIQKPGFSQTVFTNACKMACKSGQKPTFDKFAKNTCGIK